MKDYAKLYNFTGAVDIDKHGRVVWTFRNSTWPALKPHKVKGRRRTTSQGVYVTPSGVSR